MTTLSLTNTAAIAVRRGHPWVYREGLVHVRKGLRTGASVEVTDEQGTFLGRGLWDAEQPIAVRIFTRDPKEVLDASALGRLVANAIARRDGRFPDSTAYRLCNGEGDRVPGLVIDRYANVAVLRLDTEALRPHVDRIVEVIRPELASRGVDAMGLRLRAPDAPATKGAPPSAGGKKLEPIAGKALPDRVLVKEHGMLMEVDLAHGQKTGAFLDQRENRARVRALAHGKKSVLNLFSYAGGFSLAAALGGARKVTSVDIAAAAHATAQRSFRENGIDPGAHDFVSADVFAFLEKARDKGDRFDLVISDPPSFAPSERTRPRAVTAYRRLHLAAASVLAPGGILCASSCSSHVNMEDFTATLDDIALGRSDLRLLDLYGQPEDHPTLPAWPEGRYLKFVVLG